MEVSPFILSENVKGVNHMLAVHPNPFYGNTKIPVIISQTSNINLSVYNAMGEFISVIHEGVLIPGRYEFSYSADSNASGLLFLRLMDGKKVETQPMVLIRP
jgi:hypothetical protein